MSDWKPLVFKTVDSDGSESEPERLLSGKHSDREFKMIHEFAVSETDADRFIPLYAVADLDCGKGSETDAPEPDAETVRQQAYEDGLKRGEKKGFEEGIKKAEPVVIRMQELLTEMEGLWQHMVRTYEVQLIDLVGRLAEKVVLSHIALDHETVKRSIHQALDTAPEPLHATIEVNPKEVEYIETLKEDFFAQLKSLKHISLIPNASVSAGGCRIKTDSGEVDATVETKLDAVRQSIMELARGRTADAG